MSCTVPVGRGQLGFGVRRGELGLGRETALVSLVFVAIAAAVFGSYVSKGGFYSDDWANVAVVQQHGLLGAIPAQVDGIPQRPLLAVLQLLPHAVFGSDPQPHLVLAIVLAILVSICFFYLLRLLNISFLGAATVAGLVLLFPWSDSSRLWPEGSINQVAVILYLLGAITAFWGLRANGRRAALIRLGACVLFVASVLTYEATGPVALATGALYLAFASRRRALAAWGTDLLAVGAALIFSAATASKHVGSGQSLFGWLGKMARGAIVLTAHAVFPIVGGHTWVVLAVLAFVAVAAGLALLGKDRLLSAELKRPLLILAVAAVAIGLSYLMFVPAVYWTPQKPGLENRVNLVAALPIALFAYTFVQLAVLLLIPPARRQPRLRTALVGLIAVALAVDYGARLHTDEHVWVQTYRAERAELTALRAALPSPRPGTTIFTFGVPAQVAPRMPVFYDTWDLDAAAEATYRDVSINAYPVFVGSRFVCAPTGVTPGLLTPSSFGVLDPRVNGQQLPLPYGRVVFVDIVTRVVKRISSPRDCTLAASHFRPGPIQSSRLLGLI